MIDKKEFLLQSIIKAYIERWRKEFKRSVRHWLITELGQTNTEHLHIHGIIWTAQVS